MVDAAPFQLRSLAAEPEDYRLGPRSTFALGCDLGQSVDPTALSLIERRCCATGETDSYPGVAPGATNFRPKLAVRRILRAAELLPLGLSYYDVADHIAARKQIVEEQFGRCAVVFDETGARGTGEIIHKAIPSAIGVVLTAGDEANQKTLTRWTTSKADLVTSLLGAIEAGDLALAGGISDQEGFIRHLVDLRRKVSVLGRYTFNARDGAHDDYVTAAGLAYWWSSRPLQYVGCVRVIGP